MISIKVPATSANLGSGFDSLGVALNWYNYVWMEESDRIEISSKDNVAIPKGKDNLVYQAAEFVYNAYGKKMPGLKIIQENNIPMARGMGSSSACIVAGITGANELLGRPFDQDTLINFACKIEGHPDNTTPAILGGLTVSAMDAGRVYSVGTQVSDKFRFALLIPDFQLKTEQSRATLPMQYSKQDAVYNLSRSALMVASLSCGKAENLRIAVQDKLHQPFRVDLIENCAQIFELTYQNGSLGTYISGAGPCIMSIIESGNTAYYNRMIKQLEEHGIVGWKLEVLETDREGTKVLPTI